jgi:hypothetical protein
MAASLATNTRQAFARARTALSQHELDLVARARASLNTASSERDRLLESILVAYRTGDRQVWGAVLLEVLTPAMIERLKHFRPEPPVIDVEDLQAEFVVQLLEAAISMPLPPDPRFVERRLVLRAGQGVRRWLRKERRRRNVCVPVENPDIEEVR